VILLARRLYCQIGVDGAPGPLAIRQSGSYYCTISSNNIQMSKRGEVARHAKSFYDNENWSPHLWGRTLMSTPAVDLAMIFDACAEAVRRALPKVVQRIPLIAKVKSLHGQLSRRRLLRSYGLLALLFVTGLTPVLLGIGPHCEAFGLGLLFPGAGFWYASGFSGVAFAVAARIPTPVLAVYSAGFPR
jgi:hypothetical protein